MGCNDLHCHESIEFLLKTLQNDPMSSLANEVAGLPSRTFKAVLVELISFGMLVAGFLSQDHTDFAPPLWLGC